MAFHSSYMMPMFSIPQVTWANQSQGQAAMGKFPNPRSVMKICKCLVSLIIADMYQAEKLKKRAMKLLVENMRTIVTKNSEDWKKCVKSHPDLTIEITEELSKRP